LLKEIGMTGRGTILAVDDEPAALALNVRLLQTAGYQVTGAATATQGLQLARELKPDLVLLDWVLPDMDGAEVCRSIKSDPELARVFVIYLSSLKTSSEHQSQGLEGGADGYIVRPIANRELVARIDAMMRIKRAEDERERLVAELQAALAQVKILSGLLPICAACKKIRDDQGCWQPFEDYVLEHSDAMFSHTLCADCAHQIYPDEFP
jgi:DNA-binding response OmpR family regulator